MRITPSERPTCRKLDYILLIQIEVLWNEIGCARTSEPWDSHSASSRRARFAQGIRGRDMFILKPIRTYCGVENKICMIV